MLTRFLIMALMAIFIIACENIPATERLHQIDTTLLALQETIPQLVPGDITQEDADKLVKALGEAREINGKALELAKTGDAVDTVAKIGAVIVILQTASGEISNQATKNDIGRVVAFLSLTKSIIEQEQLTQKETAP